MIRKTLLFGLALLVAATVNLSNADASVLQVGDHIRFSNLVGTDAGEFGVAKSDDVASQLFRTFCLERDEFINFTDDFEVDSIQDDIVGGGQGGGSPDPLDGKTKWLYWNFYNGTLAGYNDDNNSADGLQNAIWRIEDENFSASKSQY